MAVTFHLKVDLGPCCFSAKVGRRWVTADTQEKVPHEATLPGGEITLPAAKAPDFYFWHSCCHSVKTLGGGLRYVMGPAARISPTAVPPAAALTMICWQGTAGLSQIRPQKGIVKFN